MSADPNISEAELSAFLDGELPEPRASIVAAALETDPALAARFESFGADKTMLRQAYGSIADAPLPRAWTRAIQASPVPSRRPLPWRGIAALAACLMVAVIGGTVLLRQSPPQDREIVTAALAARQGAAGGVAVDGAVPGQVNQIASAAVKLKVKIPDLKAMGYSLASLHVYDGADGAAEMTYRDAAGRVFTLYVRRSDGQARFDQFARGNLRVCVWQDEQIGTVMSGDVSTAAMQRLASLAYTGLTL